MQNLKIVPSDLWPKEMDHKRRIRVFENNKYLVQVFKEDDDRVVARLTINRKQKKDGNWLDGIGWDDLQQIKNECGYVLHDAVEVYPIFTDVVNVANMRHLWVMKEKLSFAWRMGIG